MRKAPLRIIQISDTHMYADTEKSLLGVKSYESFAAVLELIAQDKNKIDFIIHSGDLAQDNSEIAYRRIAQMLEQFNVPIYCVPGNHDSPAVMQTVYPCGSMSNDRHIITKNWQLILLDSHKPGAVEGQLDQQELDFLNHCLHKFPEHHAIPLVHHQPVLVGSRWIDNLCLTNKEDFWQIIAKFPKVKNVLFGHVHQQFETVFNGVNCYATPATCFQFKVKQDHFGIENLPPGYRWIELYDDGHLETGVVRTEKYIGVFEADAKGY